MKNEKQQKQSEKLTENKPPIEPSQSQTQCDDCSSGKDFAFFWYRFMRVL